MKHITLPTHPTMRHPRTGLALEAIGFRSSGAPIWPIMGASPDDPPADPPKNDPPADPPKNDPPADPPKDDPDLGFPKDTPVAEMTEKQQAAYWKHQSRRHEGRVKDLVGERTPEQVKQDLAAYEQFKKDQLTPAEKALEEAKQQGKAEAVKAERTKSATAIFKGALEAGGLTGDDLDEIVNNFNVAGYITDDGVDTTKITNFAKRFSPSGKDSSTRRRDFGGGSRPEGSGREGRGSAGKAEAQRRFKKQTTASE